MTSSHLNVKVGVHEEDDSRVFEKRQTSSDLPNEAKLFVRVDHRTKTGPGLPPRSSFNIHIDSETEADPSGDEWDDPDAGDADDPLMVSEYVNEIFDYMKHFEVSLCHTFRL
jgi:G2/mitotic-specific cyclin 2